MFFLSSESSSSSSWSQILANQALTMGLLVAEEGLVPEVEWS